MAEARFFPGTVAFFAVEFRAPVAAREAGFGAERFEAVSPRSAFGVFVLRLGARGFFITAAAGEASSGTIAGAETTFAGVGVGTEDPGAAAFESDAAGVAAAT